MRNSKKKFFMLLILSLVFTNCGSDNSGSSQGSSIAPPESPTPIASFYRGLPPQGWTSGVAWINSVYDTRKTGESTLQVDWVRLYCLVNGQETLVAGETQSNGTGVTWGGLYLRNPWFGNNDYHDPMTVDFSGNIAVLPLSSIKDRVWHFGGSRGIIPSGASLCYAEARVKPQGVALVQLGLDFWINQTALWCGYNQCNTEGAASDWFAESIDWIIISTPKVAK